MSNSNLLEKLSSNYENYLKVIGNLESNGDMVRSKEIARKMRVKPSSVTNALQMLREQGLIQYSPYGPIILTSKGKRVWLIIKQKFKTVKAFLVDILEIDDKTADELACTMEHSVSSQVIERLLILKKFLTEQEPGRPNMLEKLHEHFLMPTEELETEIENEIPRFLLSSLKPGEKATVHKILGNSSLRQRIAGMGITRGQVIVVERVAPLGDPIEITVRGYSLTLRNSLAKLIVVK